MDQAEAVLYELCSAFTSRLLRDLKGKIFTAD